MKIKSRVRITELLRTSLQEDGYDVEAFCDYFAEWKSSPANEYTDWFFGKDSDYVAPRRNGRRVLRHVHLPPEQDTVKRAKWEQAFKTTSRKTSDTALVYAYDPAHGYLLIYVAREPAGHALSDMATPDTQKLMNLFADQAEAFIFGGEVYL